MIDRRRFLRAALALASASIASAVPTRSAAQAPRFSRYPFSLGVASGCPTPTSVVLWTRLAPEPLEGGGMAPEPVSVTVEIAKDEAFKDIVRKGESIALPQLAHSVHPEVRGLEPGRAYWYRFIAGKEASAPARTRTAPVPGSGDEKLRFAFASCQHHEHGFYCAYRHMLADDPALVVFLGDYIYETSITRDFSRRHATPEPRTLEAYRNRHALYKGDADLQRMHAAAPWYFTWDDHEVQNDYADDRSQDLDPQFLLRRAAAYQAYYEHVPLRRSSLPEGPAMRMHDQYAWGRLAHFFLLDDRQYRSHQACPRPGRGGSNTVENCEALRDPSRTMLGADQERWLEGALIGSRARWNVLAQQTLMARCDSKPGEGERYWTDGWDGYPHARDKLVNFLAERRIANPLVIGGDVHCHYVTDIKRNFDDPASPVVASEFCGTSITSPSLAQDRVDAMKAENAHIKLADGTRRGYVLIDLTAARCTATLRSVDNAKDRASGISTRATFVVEDGRPGAK